MVTERRLDGFIQRETKPPTPTSPRPARSLHDTPRDEAPPTTDSLSCSPSVIYIQQNQGVTSHSTSHSQTLEDRLQSASECPDDVITTDVTSLGDVIPHVTSLGDVTSSHNNVSGSPDDATLISIDSETAICSVVKRTQYSVTDTVDTLQDNKADRTRDEDGINPDRDDSELDGDRIDVKQESSRGVELAAPVVVHHKLTEYVSTNRSNLPLGCIIDMKKLRIYRQMPTLIDTV